MDLTHSLFRRSGMSDTIGTEAIVGGYFNSIVFLGEFLGPVIGGCLIDKYKNIVTATSIFGFGALCVVSGRVQTYRISGLTVG